MEVITKGHTYSLKNFEMGEQVLQFINKENQDGTLVTIVDGTTNEEVIEALIDRLEFLNEKQASEFNTSAIEGLSAALLALNNRTADRVSRGVEGTNKE